MSTATTAAPTNASIGASPPTVAPKRSAYQVLMAPSREDNQQFQASDLQVTKHRFPKVFYLESAGDDIFDAIATKNGASTATTLPLEPTQIARDFILDKKRYTEAEILKRYAAVDGLKFFNKNPKQKDGTETETPIVADKELKDEFERRLCGLRDYLVDLTHPRIKAIFQKRFNQCVGEYPDVKTVEDFLDIYRTAPCGNEMRRIVDIVCHVMWGKQLFIAIEEAIVKKLNLVYHDILIKDGKPCKTKRKHGSLMSMGVRMKQTYIIDAIRHIGLVNKQEVVYERKLNNPMKGVVEVVKVTVLSHGYNGWLGICNGHYSLIQKQKDATKLQKKIPVALEDFLVARIKAGTNKNTAELLDEWKKEKSTVISICEDSANGPLTNMSSLSEDHSEDEDSLGIDSLLIAASKPAPQKDVAADASDAAPTVSPTPQAPEKQVYRPTTFVAPVKVPRQQAKKSRCAKKPTQEKLTKKPTTPTTAIKSPSTPTKKRKAEDAPPAQEEARSPIRLENGLRAHVCKHHVGASCTSLVEPYPTHFSQECLKQDNFPKQCSDCQKLFAQGKNPNKKTHTSVTASRSALICQNALNHRDHVCVFCLCHDCHTKQLLGANNGNKRTRRSR